MNDATAEQCAKQEVTYMDKQTSHCEEKSGDSGEMRGICSFGKYGIS